MHDIQGARALLAIVLTPACLIGDQAYDANDLRGFLAANGSQAVIPPALHRKTLPPFDPIAYRQRNIIERSFNRLKDWRGIAMRYDKLARNFLAGACLAAVVTYWLH